MTFITEVMTNGSPIEININDIKDELTPGATLPRYGHEPVEVKKRLLDLKLAPEDVSLLLPFIGGRVFSHLVRLVSHGGVEKIFATTWLTKYPTLNFNINKYDAINGVVSSEGPKVTMFWTFAPYLFKVLTQKEVNDEDALKMILEWSLNGDQCLQGTEGIASKLIDQQYILDYNPQHISHLFTEQQARRIVDDILMVNK